MNTQDPKQRFLLMMAMGLTFFLVLQYLMPLPEQPQQTVQPSTVEPNEVARSGGRQEQGTAAAAAAPARTEVGDFNPETDYTVKLRVGKEGRNERGFEAAFSSLGAGLTSYRLTGHYRVPGDYSRENEIIILDHFSPGADSLRVDQFTYGQPNQQPRTLGVRSVPFELVEYPAGAEVEPTPENGPREGQNLVFRTIVEEWEIIKTYRFPREGDPDFTINMDLEWRNISDGRRILSYRVAGPAGMVPDDDSSNFGIINFLTARQPAPASDDVAIERKAVGELVKAPYMRDQDNRGQLAWIGAKNRFFAALMTTGKADVVNSDGAIRRIFPASPELLPVAPDILATLKVQPQVTIPSGSVPAFEDVMLAVNSGSVEPGGSYRASYVLYAGPAVDELMEAADPRLHGVVSYTISYFDFISRYLVKLLTFLDGIFGNYGLAIIAVTLMIKILLHPLNRKSFVSMNKMQKLSPMMKEIQKKYANDKVKMQQEMSKFYKENGVSMAGGCLPVFLQLPIFFALYGAFSQGFSMRHAQFIPGWINDLSKPDSVYDFGWQIPLLNSSHLSLLPILYLALQFIQMSLQPKPADPQQAQQQKIMKFMPIMFVFIFYSMPAGLVLYFTISALAGVAENWWMRNVLLKRLGLGDSPEAAQVAAAQTKAGAGVTTTHSDAKKKKKKNK